MNNKNNLIRKVLRRMEQRRQLLENAQGMCGQFNANKDKRYATEGDDFSICLGDAGADTNLFVCTVDGYGCPTDPGNPTNYDCDSARREYTACSPVKDGNYECGFVQTVPFECKAPGGTTSDYFDCSTFKCTGESSKTEPTFDCNANVDFVCGKDNFDCTSHFKCTGGHVFVCANKHECIDYFNCAGGTTCGAANSTAINTCDPTKAPGIVNGYSDPVTDSVPGDFECGMSGGVQDIFYCDHQFSCTSKDDFSCTKGTIFICGKQGLPGSDFYCSTGSTDGFVCYTSFTCNAPAIVDCGSAAGVQPYNCPTGATYTHNPEP